MLLHRVSAVNHIITLQQLYCACVYHISCLKCRMMLLLLLRYCSGALSDMCEH